MLSQAVAIVGGTKTRTERTLTNVYHDAQKTGPMAGISRTYQPLNDDGEQLPPESTLVQLRVPALIETAKAAVRDLLDAVATQEWGNVQARADVVVDGRVIVAQAPVTYLMFLEKRLEELRTFIGKLPTLDPSERWTYDDNTQTYRTDVVQTARTKKVPRNHVLAPATDRHPAQVQVWQEDVMVGTWSTVKSNGALPAAQVRTYAERVHALILAVKAAREEANAVRIEDQAPGAEVLDFVFG